MVRYGVRHWAHGPCLFKARDIDGINAPHTWQLGRLSVVAMLEAGVTLEQVWEWGARIDAERQRDQASSRPRR